MFSPPSFQACMQWCDESTQQKQSLLYAPSDDDILHTCRECLRMHICFCARDGQHSCCHPAELLRCNRSDHAKLLQSLISDVQESAKAKSTRASAKQPAHKGPSDIECVHKVPAGSLITHSDTCTQVPDHHQICLLAASSQKGCFEAGTDQFWTAAAVQHTF